jgi:hypothetical protein
MRIFDRRLLSLLRLRELCSRGQGRHFPSFRAYSCRAVSWAALATALAGCEGNGSVVHSARLDAKPDMLCMKRAVEGLPGLSNVVYLHAAAADKPDFDEIAYQADDQRVMLMVQAGREYNQTFLRIGGFGSDGIVPRIRRVMMQVDRAVEKACHIRNLTSKVRETCGRGTHPEGPCPPLAS